MPDPKTTAGLNVPDEACGLRLFRFNPPGSENAIPCEAVLFPGGAPAVDTVLRRAAISGRVEIEGNIRDYFADVLDDGQSIVATVALDAKSYGALKNHWMRCRVDHDYAR